MGQYRELVQSMTLEEKASLCSGEDSWHTKAVNRIGVKAVKMSDGPNGLRIQSEAHNNLFLSAEKAVCFPAGCALASSFDRKLVEGAGSLLGREAASKGVQMVLGPAVNMKRSPLCGRNFEYFSEDPFLAGELGAAYVVGMQKHGVSSCVKHFAANNQEKRRMTIDSVLGEDALREIYLSAFERIVKKGKPWAMMCSYNRINGIYACENKKLLSDILRKEWGYDGIVVTDWGAMNDRCASLAAGLNLEMPGSRGQNDQLIIDAVKRGELDEALLDQRIEELIMWMNRLAPGDGEKENFSLKQDHEAARELAQECAVLLKNEDAVLPLAEAEKVAFIGGFAKEPRYQGGGSSHICSAKVDNGQREDLYALIQQTSFAKPVTGEDEKMAKEMLASMPVHSFVSFGGIAKDIQAFLKVISTERKEGDTRD